jgi:hypothetical protein
MIDIKDLKIGQKVVLVEKKYENNKHKPELDTFDKAEIVKSGRRYVTVSVGGYFKTFDSQEDFKIYHGYNWMKQGLYLSEQDYFDELKKEKLLKKIRDFFSYSDKRGDLLSLEDLESINSIIDIKKIGD